jgi:hypothetical protein
MQQYTNINGKIDPTRMAWNEWSNNKNYFKEKMSRLDSDINIYKKETIADKDINFNNMNDEINKQKNNINMIITKDKEIQQLKNGNSLLELKMKDYEKIKNETTKLEESISFFKQKLDAQYKISNENMEYKNKITFLEKEIETLKNEIISLKNNNKFYNLKKIIIKYTECEINRLEDILKEELIDDNYFLKNDIDKEILIKIIDKLK